MSAAARACAVVFSLFAAGGAVAQPAVGPTDQSGAPAAVLLPYRSALADYQRFTEEKLGSWREANDNVGRIGGWREYAKEARQPAEGSAPGPAGGATPAARDPHAGHEKR